MLYEKLHTWQNSKLVQGFLVQSSITSEVPILSVDLSCKATEASFWLNHFGAVGSQSGYVKGESYHHILMTPGQISKHASDGVALAVLEHNKAVACLGLLKYGMMQKQPDVWVQHSGKTNPTVLCGAETHRAQKTDEWGMLFVPWWLHLSNCFDLKVASALYQRPSRQCLKSSLTCRGGCCAMVLHGFTGMQTFERKGGQHCRWPSVIAQSSIVCQACFIFHPALCGAWSLASLLELEMNLALSPEVCSHWAVHLGRWWCMRAHSVGIFACGQVQSLRSCKSQPLAFCSGLVFGTGKTVQRYTVTLTVQQQT